MKTIALGTAMFGVDQNTVQPLNSEATKVQPLLRSELAFKKDPVKWLIQQVDRLADRGKLHLN